MSIVTVLKVSLIHTKYNKLRDLFLYLNAAVTPVTSQCILGHNARFKFYFKNNNQNLVVLQMGYSNQIKSKPFKVLLEMIK